MDALDSPGSGLTHEIVAAVASAAGTTPNGLETPLYEAVDPEALDRVVASDAPVWVTFEYEGYVVEVDSGRTVTVEPADRGGRR
jgi:hypothetical protein